MNKNVRLMAGWGLALALSAGMPGTAIAKTNSVQVQSVRLMNVGHTARAPLGFSIFCLKEPAHCKGGGASKVKLDTALLRTLNGVNRSVNRAIRPRNDRGDVWSINVKSGDCEDYVLAKRADLISRGVSAGSLRIATAYTRFGEGHAVLVVRTNQGDLVLDNRTGKIKEWHKTGLKFVAMTSSNPKRWNAV